jgi:hypothetical protein
MRIILEKKQFHTLMPLYGRSQIIYRDEGTSGSVGL